MTIIHMQHRYGTAAEWLATNPVLGDGELGFEKDTRQFKIGNGADAWTALTYFGAPADGPPNYYAPSPTGDDYDALQSLLNALGAAGGGELRLQSGTYVLLSDTLVIPNKVSVIGTGRSSSVIQADDGFPTGTPVVRFGATSDLSFATRFEKGTIDCNGVTGSVGVYCQNGQEMTGLEEVVVTGFKDVGVSMDTGCANYDFNSVELYPHSAGANKGFYANGNVGSNVIRRITVGVSGHLTTGIHVKNGTGHLSSIHVENCDDGVLFAASDGFVHGITGPTDASNVGTLVRVDGDSRYVDLSSITKNGATHAYKADFFGIIVDEAFVEHAVAGDLRVARFYHNGDQFGIFGKSTFQHADPGTAAGSDAAVINNIRTMLHDMGLWN